MDNTVTSEEYIASLESDLAEAQRTIRLQRIMLGKNDAALRSFQEQLAGAVIIAPGAESADTLPTAEPTIAPE